MNPTQGDLDVWVRVLAVTLAANLDTLADDEAAPAHLEAAADVEDVLDVVGAQAKGCPQPGVSVTLLHLPHDVARAAFREVMAWPGAYVTPQFADGDRVVARFRDRPQLAVVFPAQAVAKQTVRPTTHVVWAVDEDLLS